MFLDIVPFFCFFFTFYQNWSWYFMGFESDTQSRNGIQTSSPSYFCTKCMSIPNTVSSTITVVLDLFYVQCLPAYFFFSWKSWSLFHFRSLIFYPVIFMSALLFSLAFFIDQYYGGLCFLSFYDLDCMLWNLWSYL